MGGAGLTGKLPKLGNQQRRYRIRPVGSPVLETSLAAGRAAVLTFACSRPGREPHTQIQQPWPCIYPARQDWIPQEWRSA